MNLLLSNQENIFPILSIRTTQLNLGTGQIILHHLLHLKKNKSLSLKDHRFNRLSECALALLFDLDDISNFLDKYINIVYGTSILDRTFVEMEVLKPIYAAIALLGIHILKRY